MSEATEPKEPKAETKSGNSTVTWSVRIAVGAVLIALLIVAGLQFFKKKEFERSQDAVMLKFDDNAQTMHLNEAEELLQGDYETSEGKKDAVFRTNIYTWSGPLLDYKLRIKYAASSKQIQSVSGKDEEEAEQGE